MMPEIMTRAEVAKYLRISEPTVTAAVKKHGLKALQFGRVYRFRRECVIEWQRSREQEIAALEQSNQKKTRKGDR